MKRAHRLLTRTAAIAFAVAALLVGPAAATAHAGPPTMTTGEIIARAHTALGLPYVWGRESWIPNQGQGLGTDCSGFVLKCWEVPKTLLYQEEHGVNTTIYPRYTTYHFYNCLGPWHSLASRSQLEQGDILVKNNGTSGHVVLYAEGDSWGYPVIYEAPGTGLTVRKVSRYLGSEYLPRRRDSLNSADYIILDNPTAKSIGGTDTWGNWKRGSYWPGYYGDNYQATMGTSLESWARWTPRIPAHGFYDVYMRWTSGPDRTARAKVVVRGYASTYTTWVDQRTGGGQWHWLCRIRCAEGYSITSGSTTIYATGAAGEVCADSVMYDLSGL